jgi:hypothetical protein
LRCLQSPHFIASITNTNPELAQAFNQLDEIPTNISRARKAYSLALKMQIQIANYILSGTFSKSLLEKSDAGSLAWQMVGCKDADSKHIPEYVEVR